jgi:hypothetical protein
VDCAAVFDYDDGTVSYTVTADSNDFLTLDGTDTSACRFVIGTNGTNGMDVLFNGQASGDTVLFNAGAGTWTFTDIPVTLTGADSSGTLLTVTGIDQAGDSDTMVMTHKGAGDALQITVDEADGTALRLIGATSQTTSLAVIDGATGTWLGATGVGMLHLTNDGTPAHANTSLLRIAQSGTNASGQRGICASLEDTSTSGGGTEYALYIASTNNEAIHVDSGVVLVDEVITGSVGVQVGDTARTAVAGGQSTGLIAAGTSFVTITCDNATKQISLPTPVAGNVVRMMTPATGCELITAGGGTAKINDVVCGTTNELALAADSHFICEAISSTEWIVRGFTKLGADLAALVPDAL